MILGLGFGLRSGLGFGCDFGGRGAVAVAGKSHKDHRTIAGKSAGISREYHRIVTGKSHDNHRKIARKSQEHQTEITHRNHRNSTQQSQEQHTNITGSSHKNRKGPPSDHGRSQKYHTNDHSHNHRNKYISLSRGCRPRAIITLSPWR